MDYCIKRQLRFMIVKQKTCYYFRSVRGCSNSGFIRLVVSILWKWPEDELLATDSPHAVFYQPATVRRDDVRKFEGLTSDDHGIVSVSHYWNVKRSKQVKFWFFLMSTALKENKKRQNNENYSPRNAIYCKIWLLGKHLAFSGDMIQPC